MVRSAKCDLPGRVFQWILIFSVGKKSFPRADSLEQIALRTSHRLDYYNVGEKKDHQYVFSRRGIYTVFILVF
jgi:hypothetical protein